MTSNLLIAYPEIPARVTTWTCTTSNSAQTPNETEDDIAYNTFRGPKWQRWRSTYTDYKHRINYDLGPSVTATANFFAFARRDNAVAMQGGTKLSYLFQGSNDGSSYTTITSESNMSGTGTGPRNEDTLVTFNTSSAYRYFRFEANTSDNSNFTALFSKIYFGTIFDIGAEVDDFKINRIVPADDDFIASTGTRFPGRLDIPRYEVELTWDIVTDANIASFFNNIYAKRDSTGVFLYTTTFHDVLNGHQLLFCKVTEAETTNVSGKADQNNLRVKFIEDIG